MCHGFGPVSRFSSSPEATNRIPRISPSVSRSRRSRTAVSVSHIRIRSPRRPAAQILELETQAARSIGFMARIFVQATLPHSRPRTNEFERVNRRYSLHLVAPPSVGLPYGSYPRLVLAWLNTEALRTKSPELHLGPTLSTFMHKLNLTPVTGKRGTARRLRDQLHRLFSTSIRCTNSNEAPGRVECLGYTIAHEDHLDWSPPDPAQGPWWKSTITLSDEFFREITTNAVPVDIRAFRALKASPLALDIYAWLTYRMGYLRKPCLIPWKGLKTQFGADYGRLRDFKRKLLTHLADVICVYPRVRLTETASVLLFGPSRPPIRRTS